MDAEKDSNPSEIPEFDAVMRGLVNVDPAEIDSPDLGDDSTPLDEETE